MKNKGIYEKLENELNLTFIYVSNVGDFAQIVTDRYVHILLHSVNRGWLVSLIKKGYRDINAVNGAIYLHRDIHIGCFL